MCTLSSLLLLGHSVPPADKHANSGRLFWWAYLFYLSKYYEYADTVLLAARNKVRRPASLLANETTACNWITDPPLLAFISSPVSSPLLSSPFISPLLSYLLFSLHRLSPKRLPSSVCPLHYAAQRIIPLHIWHHATMVPAMWLCFKGELVVSLWGCVTRAVIHNSLSNQKKMLVCWGWRVDGCLDGWVWVGGRVCRCAGVLLSRSPVQTWPSPIMRCCHRLLDGMLTWMA